MTLYPIAGFSQQAFVPRQERETVFDDHRIGPFD